MPALIEVSTGEEEENLLFSDRAFLYRYVTDTKEWKEKGRGDVKILEHKVTGKTRVLMRREQVFKICCNHFITSQLSLKPFQTSNYTWAWSALDFSEGELVQETFALKFKTMDQAQKFKDCFEKAQKMSAHAKYDSVEKKEDKSRQLYTKSFGETTKPKDEAVDKSIIFENPCTLSSLEDGPDKSWTLLGTGNLKIVYDEEMLCAKITVVEDGNKQLLCDTVIAVASQLKVINYFSIFRFLLGLNLLFVNV